VHLLNGELTQLPTLCGTKKIARISQTQVQGDLVNFINIIGKNKKIKIMKQFLRY
jgi:hypothetical protein